MSGRDELRLFLFEFTEHRVFNVSILLVIFLNTIFIGLQTSKEIMAKSGSLVASSWVLTSHIGITLYVCPAPPRFLPHHGGQHVFGHLHCRILTQVLRMEAAVFQTGLEHIWYPTVWSRALLCMALYNFKTATKWDLQLYTHMYTNEHSVCGYSLTAEQTVWS